MRNLHNYLNEDDEFVEQLEMIKQMFLFKSGVTNGTIDLDTNPTLQDGTPKDDLDLATMEDKPWKKPGADLMKMCKVKKRLSLAGKRPEI
uniref:Pre-mRNA 3'-end-processing factor FIP1 n=1 Tax=Meloidogyne incognita TaxID=6306 RepID=A0A914LCG0_MELIC